MFKYFLFCLFAFSCLVSCGKETHTHHEVDLEQVRKQIQTLEDVYSEGENTANVDLIADYYAEDAISMPPNESPVNGKHAILHRLEEQLNNRSEQLTIKFEIVDLFAAEELAINVGRYVLTHEDGNTSTGKYISVFEYRNGKYVCIRDIWNDDSFSAPVQSDDGTEEESE